MELSGIELDSHAREGAAADGDLADTRDLGKLLGHDGGSGIIHLAFGEDLRSEPDDEDGGIGRIHFAVTGVGRGGWWAGSRWRR